MEGWSLSNRAEADWESIDDCVASAANEDVVSWYNLPRAQSTDAEDRRPRREVEHTCKLPC